MSFSLRNLRSRRDFLRVGSASLVGLSLAEISGHEPAGPAARGAQNVILVWLQGGPATIDMWDLKPNAPDAIRGDFRPIDTNVDGIQICEHLPRLAKVMDRCVLVRSVQHGLPAHGPGAQYVMSGNLPSATVEYPSLGSIASALLPSSTGMPRYLTIGNQPASTGGYLGASQNPFQIESTSSRLRAANASLPKDFSKQQLSQRTQLRDSLDRRFENFEADDSLLSGLSTFQQQAFDILNTDRIGAALRVEDAPAEIQDRYGRSPLGRHALAARQLIEAGARFVTIGTGGWDTHSNNFNTLSTRLLPILDTALSALISDLDERGLLENTIVYCAGEFGRTPQVNRSAGRDHWARASSVLLAGGNFSRGIAYGATDARGQSPTSDPCSPDDIAATLMACLGYPPDHRLRAENGRPMPLFRNGTVIDSLLERQTSY